LEANGGRITFPLRWQKSPLDTDTSSSPLRYVAEPRARYGGKKGKR